MVLDRVYRKKGRRRIVGTRLQAFVYDGFYVLVDLEIYGDGMIVCSDFTRFNGAWVSFRRFKQLITAGSVVTSLPKDAEVQISQFGSFRPVMQCPIEASEFVKEVKDAIT